jgi:4-amino-4-deoxy-L-arabinose transferase-like glycosyltransferase
MKSKIAATLLISLFAGIIFFYRLGSIPLLDPDEPRYAQASVEMMSSGDWINPQLNAQPRWDKPILFYWLIIASSFVMGVSEFSARFPSALLGFSLVLIAFLWLLRNDRLKVALLAGLILCTQIEFCVLARLAVTDMALCFFKSLALMIAFEAWRNNDGRNMIYVYAACALAVLTKGPVGILIPAIVFFCFLVFSGNLSFIKKSRFLAGTCIFLCIAAPWYVTQSLLYGDFFKYFFVLHNIQRFATNTLKHTEPFYFYFLVVLVGFIPWIFFLPRALWNYLRSYWKEPLYLFCGVWLAVEFVFFSISKAKLPTYILSIFLPLSFIMAKFWSDIWEKPSAALKAETVLMIFILAGGSGLGIYYWGEKIPASFLMYGGALLPVALGGLYVLVSSFQGRVNRVFYGVTATFAAGWLSFICLLSEPLAQTASLKNLAEAMKNRNSQVERIGSFQLFKPSLIYYGGHPIEYLKTVDELNHFLSKELPAFCVMRTGTYQTLKHQDVLKKLEVVSESFGKIILFYPGKPELD